MGELLDLVENGRGEEKPGGGERKEDMPVALIYQ